MSSFMRCAITAAVIAVALPLVAAGAQAQEKYPTKPIRLLTPFSPGGGADILARLLAPPLTETLGQPIIVDNRPGGSGTIGTTTVARSAPDGYTLILVSGSYGANAALHDLPFDTVNGITPIILVGTVPLVMWVHPTLPVKSIRDLINYSKANPDKFNVASVGFGGLDHLAGELFKLRSGAIYTVVPYKGSGPAMTALLAGEVGASLTSPVNGIAHMKAGRLRAVGVTTAARSRALPDVPAIAETIPGYDVVHWYGVWGPKGLPASIVSTWNREIAKVIRASATQKWLEDQGLETAGGPPEQFAERIRIDVPMWKKVVKEARITLNQ